MMSVQNVPMRITSLRKEAKRDPAAFAPKMHQRAGLGANFRGSCNCIILDMATDPASDAGDSRKRSGGDLSGRHDHPRRTAGSDTFYPACGDGVYHDHRFCADQRSDVFCGYVLLQVRKPDSGDSQIDSGNGDRSAGSSGYLCDQQKYV